MILTLFCSATCFASDQILIVSGGDNPGLNNYSQYLQTKTLYDFLAQKNKNNIAIYFGAGNNQTTQKPILDVRKTETVNAVKMDNLLPGIITNNIAATKQNISSYFFSEKAQSLTAEDNLFLFVSDHGLPNLFMDDKQADPYSDNCIDLWHFNGELINNFLNKENFYQVCLFKNELSTLVTESIHPKHVIFEMSQCFSGGFHQLSVSLKDGYPVADGKICGFTSAPPDHYASGCTSEASGPTYQGYERYFTEWFTGISVPTGKALRPAAKSMLEAHQNALLEDMTVDVPLTTSDYYLLQWANLFEDKNFVSRLPNVPANKIQAIYKNYRSDISSVKSSDFIRFNHLVSLDAEKILKKYPKDKAFFTLSLQDQKTFIDQKEKNIQQQGKAFDTKTDGMMNIYRNVILPPWEAAVKNKLAPLTDKQYRIETNFYLPMIEKNLFNYPSQFKPLLAQYLSVNNNDKDIQDYARQRNDIIKKWAADNNLPSIKNAVDTFANYDNAFEKENDQYMENEKEKQLLKRIYTYNKIIAAWVTLQQINDKQALNDLANLWECQHSLLKEGS